MTYAEAMVAYGSDKPDLRFDMPLHDVTAFAAQSEFKVFRESGDKRRYRQGADRQSGRAIRESRIDSLGRNGRGVLGRRASHWLKITATASSIPSSRNSWMPQASLAALPEAKPGDLVLFGADKATIVHDVLGPDSAIAG